MNPLKAPAMDSKTPNEFLYLLNAMENAAACEMPAEHGYAAKRQAIFGFVSGLQTALAAARAEGEEFKRERDKVIGQRNRWDEACQQAKAERDAHWALLQEAEALIKRQRVERLAVEAERDAYRTLLTDKAAVRANLLRGTIPQPDDLIFMNDTDGPYKKLEAERDEANAELERRQARNMQLLAERDALKKALEEFIRLDEETGLQILNAGGSDLVLALDAARKAIDSTIERG